MENRKTNKNDAPVPSAPDRVRTTISLRPDVLAIFKRMAEASGTSVSRCMGDWLTDTGDAAAMITAKMEEAQREPLRVAQEMRAMVAVMVDTLEGGREPSRAKH